MLWMRRLLSMPSSIWVVWHNRYRTSRPAGEVRMAAWSNSDRDFDSRCCSGHLARHWEGAGATAHLEAMGMAGAKAMGIE